MFRCAHTLRWSIVAKLNPRVSLHSWNGNILWVMHLENYNKLVLKVDSDFKRLLEIQSKFIHGGSINKYVYIYFIEHKKKGLKAFHRQKTKVNKMLPCWRIRKMIYASIKFIQVLHEWIIYMVSIYILT